ncbi:MAG TPA: cysteine--tRNA ligase, partial [Sphaerochaeta sp.]|nr:cysteine--tRNA ligase [Sphaerochaeta sp.]
RYFTLGGHYRSQLRFNFENLAAAKNARGNIVKYIQGLLKEGAKEIELSGRNALEYKEAFLRAVQHDLNTPKALSTLWAVVKGSGLTIDEQYSLMLFFNTILGLGFDEITKPKDVAANDEALRLLDERNEAKAAKDWGLADRLRAELLEMGYVVKDLPSGSVLEEKM